MTGAHTHRVTRRALLFGGAVISALAIGFGVGVAQAADPRLDLADDALEKAYVLVEVSESGPLEEKAQKKFDRAKTRALANIADARAQIANAVDVVDNP